CRPASPAWSRAWPLRHPRGLPGACRATVSPLLMDAVPGSQDTNFTTKTLFPAREGQSGRDSPSCLACPLSAPPRRAFTLAGRPRPCYQAGRTRAPPPGRGTPMTEPQPPTGPLLPTTAEALRAGGATPELPQRIGRYRVERL